MVKKTITSIATPTITTIPTINAISHPEKPVFSVVGVDEGVCVGVPDIVGTGVGVAGIGVGVTVDDPKVPVDDGDGAGVVVGDGDGVGVGVGETQSAAMYMPFS